MSLLDFIQQLPKAELHVHMQGTLQPELMFEIAHRNGIQLDYTLEQCKESRRNFQSLPEFFNNFGESCKVLRTEQDYYEMAMDYFQQAALQNIKYCEVQFTADTWVENGASLQA